MTGTWSLLRLALRRDRWLLPGWIALFAGMAAFSVTATKELYSTTESLASGAETINATASLVALYGRIYDPSSLGAVSLIKMTAFGAALLSVFMVFLVVRHTRKEEEAGRQELVGAGVVGRLAPLTAGLVLGIGASLVTGIVTALALMTTGLPVAGCWAFGMGWALSGMVFAAVAAVTAQVTTGARAAVGLGLAGIGIAYVLRAVGDLAEEGPGWASWLSPIGWSQQIRPFAGDRWQVVAIPILVTAALVPLAFWLRSRRDLGGGLVPDRAGPAEGRLAGVFGLALRLQRGVFLAFAAGVLVMGFVLGSVAPNISGLLDSPQMRAFFEAIGGETGLIDTFIAAEIGILGSILAAYGITAASRLRTEEEPGHTELLLSTATTRARWALSHVLVALGGLAVLIAVMGAAIGLGVASSTGDMAQIGRIAASALVQIPAAWVLVGIVMLLFGWLPRAIGAAWALLVAFIVVGEFGALWQLPQWALDISPFAHVPRLPGGTLEPGQLAGLVAVAAALAVIGFVGWQRRDVPQ